MNLSLATRRFLLDAVVIILVLGTATSTLAKKGGGGNPGREDPPKECLDYFPGFVFDTEATRKTPGAVYLGSSDGCRRDLISMKGAHFVFGPLMSATEDGKKVVILWGERLGENQPYDYRLERRDYSVDDKGTDDVNDDELTEVATATVSLPTADSSGYRAGDEVYYFAADLWGDGDHEALYVVLYQLHRTLGTDIPNIGKLLIYDLNEDPELTQPVILTNEGCSNATYSQFVPGCYSFKSPRWSPSGDRLYVKTNSEDGGFNATLVVDVNKNESLGEWIFSDAKIVFAGTTDSFETYASPTGFLARNGLSGDELAINFLDRSGNQTTGAGALLDVDQCLAAFAELSDGQTSAPGDLWMGCLFSEWFDGDRQCAWQSNEALITRKVGKRNTRSLYRIHFEENAAVTEELLVDGAMCADTGM